MDLVEVVRGQVHALVAIIGSVELRGCSTVQRNLGQLTPP